MANDKITLHNEATPFERIAASYLQDDGDNHSLSERDQDLKTRWEAAFSFILNWKSREKTVKLMMQKFDISKASAYRDIANALSLYGDITASRREGWRYVIFEYNQKLLNKSYKRHEWKIVDKCLDRMMKLADLDKEDAPFNPDKLKAINIDIHIPGSMERALNKIISKGVVDFNELPAQDTEYETLEDEAES